MVFAIYKNFWKNAQKIVQGCTFFSAFEKILNKAFPVPHNKFEKSDLHF